MRGHNDTPCGRPTPGRHVGCPGVGRPAGRIWWFQLRSYYHFVLLFSNIVPHTMEFTFVAPFLASPGSSSLVAPGVSGRSFSIHFRLFFILR
jgi:hypothetical protein